MTKISTLYSSLSADQKASYPNTADVTDPVALASDTQFLTADQKASFPTGASADKKMALDGRYENDLSAIVDGAGALLDADWTLTTAGGSTITAVASRLHIYDVAGAPFTYAELSSKVITYLPISVQCYISSIIPNTQNRITLANTVSGSHIVIASLVRNSSDTASYMQSYAGASFVNTIMPNVHECWVRIVLLGDFVQIYYSLSAETPAPSESSWVAISGFQAMDQVGVPCLCQLSALGIGAVNADVDFSNLTIQQGVEYIP